MTKQEAFAAMRQGHMVKHTYFSDDEYVYLNTDGNYWTEDGVNMGGRFDEFWKIRTGGDWEYGWEIYKGKTVAIPIMDSRRSITKGY